MGWWGGGVVEENTNGPIASSVHTGMKTLAAVSLLLILAVQPSMAQGPGGSGGPDRGGPPDGMPGGRPGSRVDPLALSGPMEPGQFMMVTNATLAQQDRYAVMYDNYQASTRSERTMLDSTRSRLGAAMESGKPDQARRLMQGMEGSGKLLEKAMKEFDRGVKDLLGKDQWKLYEAARKDQRKQMEERMPHGGPSRGPPPGA